MGIVGSFAGGDSGVCITYSPKFHGKNHLFIRCLWVPNTDSERKEKVEHSSSVNLGKPQ